jgi:phenylacetate-coenzyme A ligase PaaK-like adenylate-forming protein
VLAGLAEEQLAGRLDIAPLQVFSGGEVLTTSSRQRIRAAWRTEPFDQYLTTEAGFVAIECGAHEGLHVLDDHVLVEVVDRAGAPVEPGARGDRVLLTVLGSRTVPLIRYELDDAAAMTTEPCPCGRRSPRLLHVADQPRHLLQLPGAAGEPVAVHPVVVTSVLDAAPVRAWQVRCESACVRVLVVQPASTFSATGLAGALGDALSGAGAAALPVEVEVVDELRRGPSGKASLVVSDPAT